MNDAAIDSIYDTDGVVIVLSRYIGRPVESHEQALSLAHQQLEALRAMDRPTLLRALGMAAIGWCGVNDDRIWGEQQHPSERRVWVQALGESDRW